MDFESSASEFDVPVPLPEIVDLETERELTVATMLVTNRVQSAVNTIREELCDPATTLFAKVRILIGAFRGAFPNHDSHPAKPRFDLSGLGSLFAGVFLKFEPLSDEGEFGTVAGRSGGEMVIGCHSLLKAETPEEFQRGIDEIAEKIAHEVEHIVFPGANPDELGEGKEAAVRYLVHPGEMRAHAKQFAVKYTHAFPGEPFDRERMRTVLVSKKEINYFDVFARSEKQEEYRHIADLAAAHEKMVLLVTQLVDVLRLLSKENV